MSNAKLIFGTMPIGNFDDSTYSLINHIAKADIIAVENDETINELIDYYQLSISGQIISISPRSFMQNGVTSDKTGLSNSLDKINNEILEHISLSKTVLCLSDEGSAIVVDPFDNIRQMAISKGIKYKILPGPSAVIDSLSYSKLYDGKSFAFYGMLFYNEDKKHTYKIIKDSAYPSVVFYHHEIQDIFLKELIHFVGEDRRVTLLSNLTTHDELIFDGTLNETLGFVLKNDVKQPTLVISGKVE